MISRRLKRRVFRRIFPEAAALPELSTPRYGWGLPEHAHFSKICEAHRASIRDLLNSFLPFQEQLICIPRRTEDRSSDPGWENDWFPPLDAIALYCILSLRRPARYVEIGSGYSTRFARRAVRDNALPTSITSIDPEPRIGTAAIADRIITSPLEKTGLDVFNTLNPGDVLFVDSSHQSFMNSDVTAVFLDILPALKPGVIVHFHDIFLPYDYPADWAEHYFNEQYVLAAYMMGGSRFQLVLPNAFVTRDTELHSILDPIWKAPAMAGLPAYGASLWGLTSATA